IRSQRSNRIQTEDFVMAPGSPLRKISGRQMLSVLVLAAVAVLFTGSRGDKVTAAEKKSAGQPQLISVEPLPQDNGEMCEPVPAGAGSSLIAALEPQRAGSGASSN